MTIRPFSFAGLITAALSTAVVAAGCAAAPTASPGIEPQTLTLFHTDAGPELEPAIQWFVDAVAERSDGAIDIEMIYECCGSDAEVEEHLVAALAAGDADLGWVGTRVFADLGVDSLRALTAPFLLNDYALEQAALESPAATDALAAVGELDVTPLALLPGSLRYPLAADAPVVALADWAGLTVAAFHSQQNADALAALGAEPIQVSADERNVGVYEGTIGAIENSLLMQDRAREDLLPYATVDVALWPRASALIASPESNAASGAVAEILQRAAADVVGMTAEFGDVDAHAMVSACADGARFALAGATELTAMRTAVQPELDAIAENPDAAPLMKAIVALAEEHETELPQIPKGCDRAAPDATDAAPAGDPAVVNGRYQTVTYTEQGLLDAGLPPQEARNASAQFTLVFADGVFELIADDDGQTFGCEGEYTVNGDQLVIEYYAGGDCGPGGEFFRATFVVDEKALTLSDVEAAFDSDEYLFGNAPLTRVG